MFEANLLSILGLGLLLLAIWRGIRVRHDLATQVTRWETALFGRGEPIHRAESPIRYWCAIALNAMIVILIALVAAAAFRVTAWRKI